MSNGCGVCGVAGQNEDAEEGSVGPSVLARGVIKYCLVLTVPGPFPALSEWWGPDSPMWWLGDRVSLALGLAVPSRQRCGAWPLWKGLSGLT